MSAPKAATQRNQHADGDARAAALAEAMRSLHSTCQASLLYDEGHPAVTAAAEETARRLDRLATGKGRLTVGVARDHLLRDNTPLPDAERLAPFAALLCDLEIAAVEFRPGLSAATLIGVARLLVRGGNEQRHSEALAQQVAAESRGGVHLVPVSYSVLRIAAGPRRDDEQDESRKRVSWADLVRAILEPSTIDSAPSPEELATWVNEEAARSGDGCIAALRGGLCDLADESKKIPSVQRARTLRRLRVFLAALSPRLRQSLLRVDPVRADTSLNMLLELSDALPLEEVLDALEEVDHTVADLSHGSMMLFKRLARLTEQYPKQRSRVAQILATWRHDPITTGGASPELEESIEELLHGRPTEDFMSGEYEQQLDELTHEIGNEPPTPRLSLGLDLEEAELHAVEVAVLVAGAAPGGSGDCAGVFRYLMGHVDHLLERRRFDLVLAAARAAQNQLCRLENGPTQREAQRFIDEFRTPKRIGRVIHQACYASEVSEEGLLLLRLGGAAALERVVSELAHELPEEPRGALEKFALESSAEMLQQVIRDRMSEDATLLDGLRPFLLRLPEARRTALLEKFAAHEQVDVRRAAFRTLSNISKRWPVRFLKRALRDEDDEVQNLAIEQLAEQPGDESTVIMGALLAGKVNGRLPTADLFDRIADILTDRGEPGLSQICEALRVLCRRPRPLFAARSRRLARILRSHRDRLEVRRTLRLWQISPARAISPFVGWRSAMESAA
jgi:hypothetical protein